MTVLIDNYDSFSYNLYQMIGEYDEEICVIRNDEMSVAEIENLHPNRIILSPGPGRPEQAGIMVELIQKMGSKVPILGVCLGHQAICIAYGGRVTYAKKLMHGKQSSIFRKDNCSLFKGCRHQMKVARYHSLIAKADEMPEVLEVLATTEDDEIMAIRHREYEVYGVQFHPESIMTPDGKKLIENFMNIRGE